MKLIFSTLAQQKLEEAKRYYNRQQIGLGIARGKNGCPACEAIFLQSFQAIKLLELLPIMFFTSLVPLSRSYNNVLPKQKISSPD